MSAENMVNEGGPSNPKEIPSVIKNHNVYSGDWTLVAGVEVLQVTKTVAMAVENSKTGEVILEKCVLWSYRIPK